MFILILNMADFERLNVVIVDYILSLNLLCE